MMKAEYAENKSAKNLQNKIGNVSILHLGAFPGFYKNWIYE